MRWPWRQQSPFAKLIRINKQDRTSLYSIFLTFKSLAVTACTTSHNVKKIYIHSSHRIFIIFVVSQGKHRSFITVNFGPCEQDGSSV